MQSKYFIKNLKVWLDANELTLDLNKSECLIIPPSNTIRNQNLNPIFYDEYYPILSSCSRYLGVFIDSQLTYKTYIENLEYEILRGVVY